MGHPEGVNAKGSSQSSLRRGYRTYMTSHGVRCTDLHDREGKGNDAYIHGDREAAKS